MSVTRIETWPEVLDRELRLVMARPFAWGTHDCCLFAADVVLAMTGVDYAAEFRGQYDSALTAARVLERAGGLRRIVERRFGDGLPWQYGYRGDLALIDSAAGEASALGVVVGSRIAAAGPEGLVFVPLSAAHRVWSV